MCPIALASCFANNTKGLPELHRAGSAKMVSSRLGPGRDLGEGVGLNSDCAPCHKVAKSRKPFGAHAHAHGAWERPGRLCRYPARETGIFWGESSKGSEQVKGAGAEEDKLRCRCRLFKCLF